MIKKYEVIVGDECWGVYYGESEEDAIREFKRDLNAAKQKGIKFDDVSPRDLVYKVWAREVDY